MTKIAPEFYATHGPVTNPRGFAPLLAQVPPTVEDAVKTVQGLLTHIFWAERCGIKPDEQQKQHVQTRYVSRILEKIQQIEPLPLAHERPLAKRFFGNCRDFAVLTTAILRQHGIPARARCGFGSYFWREERYEDHWVLEYWNGSRWIMLDSQLDEFQQKALHLNFDVMDMPAGKFLSAALAWQLCREGKRDPEKFGIFDMHGLWFIGSNLIREVASLNKVEMLPWDIWGYMNKRWATFTPDDFALLDEVSRWILTDDAKVHEIYCSDARFTVPSDLLTPRD